MATTTILEADLETKQRRANPGISEQEIADLRVGVNGDDQDTKSTPLALNLAANAEAFAGTEPDPYGYRRRKKTVSELDALGKL